MNDEITMVSLFDGISGFPYAFEQAGIRTVATVEIDGPAAGVAGRHFPNAKHFRDIREVTGADLLAAGFDPRRGIIAAGFPCQDLSLAGRRMGLGAARSGLFFEIMRIIDEILQITGVRCRWLVLENVPGLLSSVCACPGGGICTYTGVTPDGERITCAAGPHAVGRGACGRRVGAGGRFTGRGRCMEIHGGAMGAVLGSLAERGYGYAYRVLDAQHFGVPQRRRRVFIVANPADWSAPATVLLEPHGGAGDPAAGGAARARTALVLDRSIALAGRAGGGVVGSLTANMAGGGTGADPRDAQAGHLIPLTGEVSPALTRRNATGSPNSEGDGLALIGQVLPFDEVQITHPENRSRPELGDPAPTLNGSGRVDVAYALRADPGGVGQGHNVTFVGVTGDVSHTLTADGHDASEDGTGRGAPIVSPVGFGETGGDVGSGDDLSPALRTGTGGGGTGVADAASGVRRLTPVECERLQGYPDGWTERSGDVEQSDAARHRQLGNSVAVPVVYWVALGIVEVESCCV